MRVLTSFLLIAGLALAQTSVNEVALEPWGTYVKIQTAKAEVMKVTADWLVVTVGQDQVTPTGIRVSPNESGLSRTTTIEVGGNSYRITQAGRSCECAVSREELATGAKGETLTVDVTPGEGCTCSPQTQESWINLGSLGDTLSVTVAANTSTTARKGTITIGDMVLVVKQEGIRVIQKIEVDATSKAELVVTETDGGKVTRYDLGQVAAEPIL